MKNKIIIIIVLISILAYPLWRYFHHSEVFAKAVVGHLSQVGEWSYRSISGKLNGLVTIRGLTLTPKNYDQKISIDTIDIKTSPLFLFSSSQSELNYLLPETLSISFNSIILENNATDLEDHLKDQSFWILMAGYAGSFGCKRESYSSFDDSTWQKLFDKNQYFNLDLYYARQQDGSLDLDLIVDAENQFSTTWSGNLQSSYNDKEIIIEELIVDKLFYSYLDNGFNLKRNNVCKENYKSSFAAYRLSSADHVQKYLRTYYEKELPPLLISWYQRMLAPDVEYNAIISLNERMYLNDIFSKNQRKIFENSVVEIATQGNEYLPVKLVDIDYRNKDSERLKIESIKKEEQLIAKENTKKTYNALKPKISTIGKISSKKIPKNKLANYINQRLRIKTQRGRPITGNLVKIKDGLATIQFNYKSGTATLDVKLKSIATIELIK